MGFPTRCILDRVFRVSVLARWLRYPERKVPDEGSVTGSSKSHCRQSDASAAQEDAVVGAWD